MIRLKTITEFWSVVLVGTFNPSIFHPTWFLSKKLISERDANASKNVFVHPEFATFNIGGWIDINIKQDRCEFKISQARNIVLMRDLVIGTMNALPECPIKSLGINRGCVADLGDKESYYQFGAKLAPLDIWTDSFQNPKLRTIAIEDTGSEGFNGKCRTIFIRPADNPPTPYCVDLNMNNHYEFDVIVRALQAIETIDSNIMDNYNSFDSIFEKLINRLNS